MYLQASEHANGWPTEPKDQGPVNSSTVNLEMTLAGSQASTPVSLSFGVGDAVDGVLMRNDGGRWYHVVGTPGAKHSSGCITREGAIPKPSTWKHTPEGAEVEPPERDAARQGVPEPPDPLYRWRARTRTARALRLGARSRLRAPACSPKRAANACGPRCASRADTCVPLARPSRRALCPGEARALARSHVRVPAARAK